MKNKKIYDNLSKKDHQLLEIATQNKNYINTLIITFGFGLFFLASSTIKINGFGFYILFP